MKVSLAWLKEFISVDLYAEELADVLTLAGLEVEGMDKEDGDIIFDVAITPNLGHCMSMVGIAHEIAAFLDLPMRIPDLAFNEEGLPIKELIEIEVQDRENCPRYCCRIVEGIKVGPSPDWLKEKLEKSGLRSVNNVVDVTNFVMLGLGQPMHAFDLDKIEGKKIVVSSNMPFEQLLTLDDQERDLPKESLLICDAKNPIAIAGVIGGKESAVEKGTTRILLEAAYFNEAMVRRVSKWLGLRTDSSVRFERGIDPNRIPLALDRCAAIIQKIGGGKIARGRIDEAAREFPPKDLFLRSIRVNAMLGTKLSLNEIISFLKRLNIEIVKEEDETLLLKIPTYRNDLQMEIDLIEEIARIYGYNNIPLRAEKYQAANIPDSPMYLFEKIMRIALLQEGLQEWMTCDLVSPSLATITEEKKEKLISVLKAASVDQSVLRTSLLPSLLLSVKHNLDHQNETIHAFEVGRIHFKEKAAAPGKTFHREKFKVGRFEEPDAAIPFQGVGEAKRQKRSRLSTFPRGEFFPGGSAFKEESAVGIVLMGLSRPYHFDPKPKPFDFFDCKGIVENLLEKQSFENVSFAISHAPHFHPKRQSRIKINNQMVGILGQLHPSLLKELDIDKEIYFAHLNLHALLACKKRDKFFSGLPIFPSSQRDWTLTVKDSISVEELLTAIEMISSPYLEKITVLDLYKSDQIGKDRKNVTFRFVYRDPKKTIALDTVEKEHAKITEVVTQKFNI